MQKANLNSFDLDIPTSAPGFRLDRLELWNWGTFHGEAQVLEPCGGWSLLVGDNGSGKSTAIDALRTLLVPPRLLNYNDASGDGRRVSARDRTRRSYIRGAWASSSTVDSTSPTTQYLRAPGILSGISAVFVDSRQSESVTLAQILWEYDEEVREIFAISRATRSLRDLIAGQTNTAEIKRIAKRTNWEVHDSFSAYAERMRKLLCIPGEKALEVFNRAIGMKEVGDIDGFVRQFLLPSADTFTFIRDTVQPHYRTLLDCWAAIDRAERQIALLRPVSESAERISAAELQIAQWRELQDSVRPYYAMRHLKLLESRATELKRTSEAVEVNRSIAASDLTQHRRERDNLNAAISATDVGPRLQALEREIEISETARLHAQIRRDRIQPSVSLLDGASFLIDATSFVNARASWEATEQQEDAVAIENEETRAACRHRQEIALAQRNDTLDELRSVEQNRVNIPRTFLGVRSKLCEALKITANAIPFAGELMEVKSAYADWAGAIEHLLRGFGLSLLVPEQLYRSAAEYINTTPLGLRLVFHRVPARVLMSPNLTNDRVPGRLAFRSDHPLHLWVTNELARRFNHLCCQTVADLEKVDRGLTREGLMRDGTRHIKDDTRAIESARDRILGWSIDRKIAALRVRIVELEKEAESEARGAAEAGRSVDLARRRASAARDLLNVAEFSEIDPQHWSEQLIRLRMEKSLLERNSKELYDLRSRLHQVETGIDTLEIKVRELDGELGRLDGQMQDCEKAAEVRKGQLRDLPAYDHEKTEVEFTRLMGTVTELTLQNADQLAHAASQSIQGKINYEQGKINDAAEKMAGAMSEFIREFGEFRQTLAVGRAYADSFTAVLRRVEEEDLPRHRERFEHYLNENLVGDLLMLNRRLEEHQETIESRVEEVNEALRSIEYSEDTYVQLHLVSRPNVQVSEFKRSLRECFEYGIAPAPEERLRIFGRVRSLLEKFQDDPDGTQRVTDVRGWFAAGVRELRQEDDSEVNFYAATTGKSGGQKAKLAFTILASALAAQYGLSPASSDASNFRLVVIDEAFSRTDEQNSQRAMQLFASLGFQLVIVGPFDAKAKLAVPFVRTIHLASNPAGNNSQLIAITRQDLESTDVEGHEIGSDAVDVDNSVTQGVG